MLLRILEIFLEALVELRHRVGPLLFALFDLIELFFETRGISRIEDLREVLDQQIGDDQADFCRHELAANLLDVLTLLNRSQNGSVSRWPSDPAFFEFLHQ